MKKMIIIGLTLMVMLPLSACEVTINDEKIIDLTGDTKRTTICGQNMVFNRVRDTDMRTYYWGEVKIKNTYDQGSHIVIMDKSSVNNYLEEWLGPMQEKTVYPYIPQEEVRIYIRHQDHWEWYSCTESGTKLNLE